MAEGIRFDSWKEPEILCIQQHSDQLGACPASDTTIGIMDSFPRRETK
jgi:hypothetical protein